MTWKQEFFVSLEILAVSIFIYIISTENYYKGFQKFEKKIFWYSFLRKIGQLWIFLFFYNREEKQNKKLRTPFWENVLMMHGRTDTLKRLYYFDAVKGSKMN